MNKLQEETRSILRSRGFVHITGLRAGNGKVVAFPKALWGKAYQDGLGVVLYIEQSGRVWLKYGTYSSQEDLALLGGAEDIGKLERSPIDFNPHTFLNALNTGSFAIRVGEPDYDFRGACNPDPNSYS